MKQLLVFVRKEFLHVLRDKRTLLILFGMPIMQILIFGFALTNEVKNAQVLIVDQAHDEDSRRIIEEIDASSYFDVSVVSVSTKDIAKAFQSNNARIALVFPVGFGEKLQHTRNAQLQIVADASDPNTATTLRFYLTTILADYQQQMSKGATPPMQISTSVRMLYNPQLRGAPNFVPGVIALVLMLVCVMMTSIAIVREKELGTMEILLVSPFKPLLVLLAKVIPYLILSLANVASILLLSTFVLDVPVQGSVLLLFAASAGFIVTCLSLGILISTVTDTQQAAMLVSMMGLLLPTILFSGFMFPIENMPLPLQLISNAVPAKWYYLIVKDIMIKGLGIEAIAKELAILTGMTLVLILVSLKKFKVRLT
ncbi:MAG: ABC transporter permease [bacterium]|nr:ABC transporter permease [bacterium]